MVLNATVLTCDYLILFTQNHWYCLLCMNYFIRTVFWHLHNINLKINSQNSSFLSSAFRLILVVIYVQTKANLRSAKILRFFWPKIWRSMVSRILAEYFAIIYEWIFLMNLCFNAFNRCWILYFSYCSSTLNKVFYSILPRYTFRNV